MAKVNIYVGVRDEPLMRQLRAMLARKRLSLGTWLIGLARIALDLEKEERAKARGAK